MGINDKKQKPVSGRAADIGDLLIKGSTGFAARKKTGVGLFIHFFLLTCMVILGVTMLVRYNSPQGCILTVTIGGVFALVAHNLEKLKQVKQSLEFMNALFSSALGKSYQFCCIVKNTGDIVFFNRPFQAVFPAYITQSDRKIDALFNIYNVPQDQRDKFTAITNSGGDGTVNFTFRESDAAASVNLTTTIEIIDRPTGFYLVRGR